MIVQTVAQVPHIPIHVHKLLITVPAVLPVIISEFILHIEGLGHIQAIQPDLVGIDLFMPEITFRSPGLAFQLTVYGIDGFAVLFLAGEFVQIEKSLSGIDVVQIILQRVIGLDRAVFTDKIVDEFVGEFQVFRILLDVIQLQYSLDHTAVNIVPGRLPSLFDFLDIPYRSLGTAFLQQLVDVTVQNFHNTYLVLSIWLV